jgi:hypothetical protein
VYTAVPIEQVIAVTLDGYIFTSSCASHGGREFHDVKPPIAEGTVCVLDKDIEEDVAK